MPGRIAVVDLVLRRADEDMAEPGRVGQPDMAVPEMEPEDVPGEQSRTFTPSTWMSAIPVPTTAWNRPCTMPVKSAVRLSVSRSSTGCTRKAVIGVSTSAE